MVLKPQDVYVVLKIVASGFRSPYAQPAGELAMSPSEVHASAVPVIRGASQGKSNAR